MRYAWVILLMIVGCVTKKAPDLQHQSTTLVPLGSWPALTDNGDLGHLKLAIDRQLDWFETIDDDRVWNFEGRAYGAEDMRDSLLIFQAHFDKVGGQNVRQFLQRDFHLFQMTVGATGDVLMTGYHAPVYSGSLVPDDHFRFPLYRMPDDVLTIETEAFAPEILRKGDRLVRGVVYSRLEGNRVLPYFSRTDIDRDGALEGRNLELVYLGAYVDAFLFHVQGGGFVALPDGRFIKLNYAGKNGWPYRSIGRVLVEEGKVPQEEISVPAIKQYFQAHPEEEMRVCFVNQSYVFYQWDGLIHENIELDHYPHGVLGFPVTPRRSIATDKRLFPGGALAWISGCQRTAEGDCKPISGFVLDQDTGGAIEGAHIDLFMGAGDEPEENAGLMMDPHAFVYFLVATDEALARWRSQ
ncbi:MAG: MltA domain-containing protein [Acidobacteria bacterium]|nr:MltA domain-containing protein [Acidobacteriota bacterium]